MAKLARRSIRCSLVAPLLALAACGDNTAVVIQVVARPGVHDQLRRFDERVVDHLLVSFTNEAENLQQVLSPKAGKTIFNAGAQQTTIFSLQAPGRSGDASIVVEARNSDNRVLGDGATTVAIQPDQTVEESVTLLPTDFQVNSTFKKGSQIFSTGPTGRQVASDAAGNFVVLFEDLECPHQRCDIFGRLFDASGMPRTNAENDDAEDFIVNPASVSYDHPAVAMHPDGRFVAVWIHLSDGEVYARSFQADGQGNDEVLLSDPDHEAFSPDVAVLDDGNFVAVWAEAIDASTYKIIGRLIGADGQPLAAAFDVSIAVPKPAWLVSGSSYPWIARIPVAVAGGPSGGFMVVWRETCASGSECWNIRGRGYGAAGAQLGISKDIATKKTNAVGGFDLARQGNSGYVIVWDDELAETSETEGRNIRLRRVAAGGEWLTESEYTFNTTTDGDQRDPAIAVRADGPLLVAWSSEDTTHDPNGGVRGRRMLANGLPVGADMALNTTMPDSQNEPSVAAVGQDAFVVVFQDASQAGPDTLSSGIRARVLYPDFGSADGQIGARCDTVSCATGLVCDNTTISGRSERRCIVSCNAEGDPCPHGGRCLKLAAEMSYRCIYP